jgi:prepilin-type N-terminal cleavage/methylation domain-containing protein
VGRKQKPQDGAAIAIEVAAGPRRILLMIATNHTCLASRRGRSSCLRHRTARSRGFSLIEGVIALAILGSIGGLLFSTFSFSVRSQEEARDQQEAARAAGQIIEILRGTSFDALNLVEYGGLHMDPLGRFQQMILLDIEDRLYRDGLSVYLTVRLYKGRTEAKLVTLTIVSDDVSPRVSPEQLPPGKTLVKQTTIVTKKGINP